MMTIAVPNMSATFTNAMYQNVVCMLSTAYMNVVTVTIVNPTIANHFAPNMSKMRPVTGDMIPITTAPGNNARPESIAEKCRMFCMYNGRTVIPPIITMNTHMPRAVLSVNMAYRNTRNSSTGCGSLNCRHTNKTSATTPTANGTNTCSRAQPPNPATLKPYSRPPNPNDDKIMEATSKRGYVRSLTFLRMKYATIVSIMAIGNII